MISTCVRVIHHATVSANIGGAGRHWSRANVGAFARRATLPSASAKGFVNPLSSLVFKASRRAGLIRQKRSLGLHARAEHEGKTNGTQEAPRPLWLDCDPGHDDAMAIILAAYNPNVSLIGVSTVFGNQTVRRQAFYNSRTI
eukprot:3791627-Pyramimonas_sp.AAC.3